MKSKGTRGGGRSKLALTADMAGSAARLHLGRLGVRFAPFSLVWYVTWQCNCRCAHCHWGRRDADYAEAAAQEMTAARCLDVLREAVSLGLRHVAFSGGEALLKDGMFDLLAGAKSLGLATEISSNGILPSQADVATRLVETGIDNIHISLDYPDETHDLMRDVPNLFRMVMRTLENLSELRKRRRFYFGVNAVAFGANFTRLEEIANLVESKGVDGFSVQIFHPQQVRNREALDKLLVPQDKIPEFQKTVERLIAGHSRLLRNSPQFLRGMARFALDPAMPGEPCSAGVQQIYVFPNGEISPCCFLPKMGDLRKQGFHEMVFSDEFDALRKRARRKECPGCWSPGTHEYNAILKLRSLPSVMRVAYNYLRTR
ncbi:MAG TPA: radical SAM protein [Candidatus Brocadiia bacterium]|nr:radical SAM protein [Candidatus Brocadiia bacterium]